MVSKTRSDAEKPAGTGLVMVGFHHFPPYPGAGSIRALYFMRALVSLRDQASLLLLTTVTDQAVADGEVYPIVPLGRDPIDNRRSLPSRALGEIGLGVRLGLQLLVHRPTVAVISSPGFLFAAIAVLAARIGRVPYVLDVRDIYPEVYASAGVLRAQSLPFRLLQKLSDGMYRHARLVVAATQGLVQHIVLRAPAQRVEVVYNGCPSFLLTHDDEKHQRFTCVFHGILGFYQDASSLLALAEALAKDDVDVVVVGYGRGEDVLRNATHSNLRFLGRLPFSETVEVVAKCQVGLCLRNDDPISRDAFPVKVFEYIGLGLPVIVTPPSEAGDFISRHGCGDVVASGDIQAMRTSVLRMREDADLYRRRARACREAAVAFTREGQSAKFANLVGDALMSVGEAA